MNEVLPKYARAYTDQDGSEQTKILNCINLSNDPVFNNIHKPTASLVLLPLGIFLLDNLNINIARNEY